MTPAASPSSDGRSRRAREEPMRVSALGDSRYEVATAPGNVYEVDLDAGRCACPDHQFRGVRCKHLRRVALEVTAGNVPAPGERAAGCAACGDLCFVPEADPDPVYCGDCTLAPGETVVDRELGKLVVVVETTDRRADEVEIAGRDWTVAEHHSNRDYDPRDVVVDVLFPLGRGVSPEDVTPEKLKRYSFPRGRLRRPQKGQ
ncbi:SWIM zinc finger family protein [Halobacterium litoreum]|uniref:SWIM zinc finger family protein n=1 Tax=Halobacterium litoreum TaxID=2039234 RepID=A0ABD5NFU7_9EURY|nr:SWIM zinc finger family protein [Halobacterium litoreum]UHH13186.1 SWIM zinc finger family protein [Halobacterium litoreum]